MTAPEAPVPDLAAIRVRHSLARMAGEAATDAGEGWDQAKIDAVVRSWQDVAVLHDFAKRVLGASPEPRHRASS